MSTNDLLADAFGRVQGVVHDVVEGLDADALAFRPDGQGNSIAWLIWHLTRVQDDHISELAGLDQVYATDGWADRLGLPLDASDTGYGHSSKQVSAVRVESGDLLTGYHDAVCARTLDYVRTLKDQDFERIVDESYDPPVTLAVRLISVIDDDTQHAGQAAYVRGLLPR
jgi:hypothetical protein